MTNLNAETRSMIAIANDIYADKTGRCTISIRGMANLLGVARSTVQKRLDLEGCPTNAAWNRVEGTQTVTQQVSMGCSLRPDFGADRRVDDSAFHKLIFWYAVESPRGRTQEAKDLLQLTSAIGVRGWMQAEAGHNGTVQELVQSVKIDRSFAEINQAETIDRLNELVNQKDAEALALRSNIEKGYVGAVASGRFGQEHSDAVKQELRKANARLKALGLLLEGEFRPEKEGEPLVLPTDAEIAVWVNQYSKGQKPIPGNALEARLEALENAAKDTIAVERLEAALAAAKAARKAR